MHVRHNLHYEYCADHRQTSPRGSNSCLPLRIIACSMVAYQWWTIYQKRWKISYFCLIYWAKVHEIFPISLTIFLKNFCDDFCRTQKGPAYTRLFNFCPYVRPYVRPYIRTSVRPYVSNSFSLLLLDQYTSDPQYFYRFRTPYKMTIRGAD